MKTENVERPAPSADSDPGINHRIAAQMRHLRAARKLSLDALAARCGVSRSALSLIERAESSATAVVLDKLAAGLGVPLAALFVDVAPAAAPQPLARHAQQMVWRDPGSGYLRRSVSPEGFPSPIRIVEVTFPPGARVAYETGPRESIVHQQIWVLEGAIEFTLGDAVHALKAGDCLALILDRPTIFHNRSRKAARYAVVLAAEPLYRKPEIA